MKTEQILIKGRKVRCRRVYRGYIRATDWLEGSAVGSLASDNPKNFVDFRIGSGGGIPGIIVYRPIVSKPRTEAGKREPEIKPITQWGIIWKGKLQRGHFYSSRVECEEMAENAFRGSCVEECRITTISYRKKK